MRARAPSKIGAVQTIREADPRGLRRVGVVCLLVLLLAGAGLMWRQHGISQARADRNICRAMQGLDGHTYDPLTEARIRASGSRVEDRLGAIARHADARVIPGHLSLVSEEYDVVDSRCFGLGLPVTNV